MQPSIIIADDHPLILKGLHDFLIEKKFDIIDSATDGKAAFELILKHRPDIAILDIRMPLMTGLEIAKACKVKGISTKIAVITFEKSAELYYEAINLGVYGYILKEFALVEIEKCIKSILLDTPYFSPELMKHLESLNIPKGFELLTGTEKRIIELISKNQTAAEIAELQEVSIRTIEKHRSNIIKKLNLTHKPNTLLIWAKENQDFF